MKKKLIVVAGNPRSGTSLTMNLSAEAVGIDRIIGTKFPMLDRAEGMKKQGKDESDNHYAMRQYIEEGYPKESEESIQKSIDMNPNGFYEHPQFSVRGISYTPSLKKDIERLENAEETLVIKLVNSGLFASDPKYIGKVIYLIRHPYDIAKSQERLKRSMKFALKDGREVDLYEGVTINDPDFYIKSTIQYAKWREENSTVPVLYIHFNDLISDPVKELKKIADFTGIKEYTNDNVVSVVEPKLKRSEQIKESREKLWEEASQIHEWLCEGRIDKICEFDKIKDSWFAKRHMGWLCPRIATGVGYANCFECMFKKDKEFIINSIKYAEHKNIDWRNAPCTFECGFDPENDNPKTIEESIKNNHWVSLKDTGINLNL